MCRQINSGIEIELMPTRLRRSQPFGNVVFACVDSITDRRHIFEAAWSEARLFVDGRMSAEALRVLVVADDLSASHYADSLFTPDQAFAGSCAAKSTIFCANVCAGLMVAQLVRWLRRTPVEQDIVLNLLAGEWSAMRTASV